MQKFHKHRSKLAGSYTALSMSTVQCAGLKATQDSTALEQHCGMVHIPLKLAFLAYALVIVALFMIVLLKSASETRAPDKTLSDRFLPV